MEDSSFENSSSKKQQGMASRIVKQLSGALGLGWDSDRRSAAGGGSSCGDVEEGGMAAKSRRRRRRKRR